MESCTLRNYVRSVTYGVVIENNVATQPSTDDTSDVDIFNRRSRSYSTLVGIISDCSLSQSGNATYITIQANIRATTCAVVYSTRIVAASYGCLLGIESNDSSNIRVADHCARANRAVRECLLNLTFVVSNDTTNIEVTIYVSLCRCSNVYDSSVSTVFYVRVYICHTYEARHVCL